jgi:hypothetical protein
MRKLLLLVAVLGTVATLSAAETRWVERTKVDISVRTPRAKTGWVFQAALVNKPVQPGDSNFLKLIGGDASTSRTAASQGAKGIYAQEYAKSKGYDYAFVEWTESHQPTGPQIDAFLKDPGK